MTDPSDAAKLAPESPITVVSERAQQLVGVLTASGFAALVYAAGYVAVSRTGDMLGVPSRDPGAGAYVRGGYLFFLQTVAAAVQEAVDVIAWLTPSTVWGWVLLSGAIAAGWYSAAPFASKAKWPPRVGRFLVPVLMLASYAVATGVTTYGADRVLAVLEADNLWFRAKAFVKEDLRLPAQAVVTAIADRDEESLRTYYRRVTAALTGGIVLCLLGLFGESRLDKTRWWSTALVRMKWLPIASVAILMLLLPSLYGVCYLVPKLVCVGITANAELDEVIEKESLKSSGILLSDIHADPIEILAVEYPPVLLRYKRDQVLSVKLQANCEVLPGFKTPPAKQTVIQR